MVLSFLGGSSYKSFCWGVIEEMHRIQSIDPNPSKMHLFYRDLKDVSLVLPACLLGEGPVILLLRQPCLGRFAMPPIGGWMGSVKTGFRRLSPVAFCLSSESQSKVTVSIPLLRTQK